MKKIITTFSIFAIVCAMAVTAQAQSISSKGNEWFATVPSAGTIVVKDNKKEFEYNFEVAGTYLIGKQSGYTGQLKFVRFEAAYVAPAVDTAALAALEAAKAEYLEWVDTAFVLIGEIQYDITDTDLWNTDACQDLYHWAVEPGKNGLLDNGTLEAIEAATDSLQAAYDVASEMVANYYASLNKVKTVTVTFVDPFNNAEYLTWTVDENAQFAWNPVLMVYQSVGEWDFT